MRKVILAAMALSVAACGSDVEEVKQAAAANLRNPESAQFRNVRVVESYLHCEEGQPKVTGDSAVDFAENLNHCRYLTKPPREGAVAHETVCGEINGENGFGGMGGFTRFNGSNGIASLEPDEGPGRMGGVMSAYSIWANDYIGQCHDDPNIDEVISIRDSLK